MNCSQPKLLDILYPCRYPAHPKRTEVTRTINQLGAENSGQDEPMFDEESLILGTSARTSPAFDCSSRGAT